MWDNEPRPVSDVWSVAACKLPVISGPGSSQVVDGAECRTERAWGIPAFTPFTSRERGVGLANNRARDRRPWQVLGDDVQPPTDSFRLLRAAGGLRRGSIIAPKRPCL